VDFILFSVTAASLFLFRRQDHGPVPQGIYRSPGHPYTTAVFVLTCMGIVVSTIVTYPRNSGIGIGILLSGIPVYLYWSRRSQ
jgi:basic amino acid/polyamine antiporter, APA family